MSTETFETMVVLDSDSSIKRVLQCRRESWEVHNRKGPESIVRFEFALKPDHPEGIGEYTQMESIETGCFKEKSGSRLFYIECLDETVPEWVRNAHSRGSK